MSDDRRFLRTSGGIVDLRAVVALAVPPGPSPHYGITLFLQGGGSVFAEVGTNSFSDDYAAAAARGDAELARFIALWKSVRA